MKRLTTDEYLWSLAFAANKRSTCDRLRAGCVVARNGSVLATGYNGSVPGEAHCDEAGHELEFVQHANTQIPESHCVRTIHAEINVIINAAMNGINISDADWYITGVPCKRCSMAIARLRPNRVFFVSDMGGNDRWQDIVDWWEARMSLYGLPKNLYKKTKKQLEETGVVEPD